MTLQTYAEEVRTFPAWRDADWQGAFELKAKVSAEPAVPQVDAFIGLLLAWAPDRRLTGHAKSCLVANDIFLPRSV